MAGLTEADLAGAKVVVAALLECLGISAYIFAVEPREGAWAISVECATESGWQRSELRVSPELLAASRGDPEAREALLAQWRAHLAACKTG